MSEDKLKITVIGGGVGGYPAAIRAARRGAQVTLIEKAEMGGTCLNRGCIPTKSLLHSVEIASIVKEAKNFGVDPGGPVTIDFAGVMKRKNSVVKRLRKGIESLVRAKKITLLKGNASVIDRHTVRLEQTGKKVRGDRLIIATGSVPRSVSIPGIDQAEPWTSDDFLEMETPPVGAVIIGGGVIGVELAQILAGFGSKVTVLEMMPQLVPGLDTEIAQVLQKELEKQGVQSITSAQVIEIWGQEKKRGVAFRQKGKTQTIETERVIVAVGRKPCINGIDVKKLGLTIDNGAIQVNEHMETNVSGVYAVGDVTGGVMLAHAASAEGECAAINATGGNQTMDSKAIPSCIYTTPEVATVGLNEADAKKKTDVVIGRFPFSASGKAVVLGRTAGMVKIVADTRYKEVLGVQIIGPHATDLIAEAVLGMKLEATAEELAHAVHPHPTLSESMMEAALSLVGGAVHIP